MLLHEIGHLQVIPKMIDLLYRAIAVDPDEADSHYYLAWRGLLGQQRLEAKSLTHLRECLRLKPDHKKAAELPAELSETEQVDEEADTQDVEGAREG